MFSSSQKVKPSLYTAELDTQDRLNFTSYSLSKKSISTLFNLGYVDLSLFVFMWTLHEIQNLHHSQLLKQPQCCPVSGDCALLKGTLMASCRGRKEPHLFCNSPDGWLNRRLFAYLTCRRLMAHYIWIARLQHGRQTADEFNAFVIEFKRQLTLIFVLHITSCRKIQY